MAQSKTYENPFDFKAGLSSPAALHKIIHSNTPIRSGRLYLLILSILIICIGLDDNSNTLTIGGMVLSPLLGSIMATAYYIATKQYTSAVHTFLDWLFSSLLCILLSILYFYISPMDAPTSETLLMASLSYEDILISIVGGTALAIGYLYQLQSSTTVAISIATTLAPPLSTAGFAVTVWDINLFSNALFLFLLNSLLIYLFSLMTLCIFIRAQKHLAKHQKDFS